MNFSRQFLDRLLITNISITYINCFHDFTCTVKRMRANPLWMKFSRTVASDWLPMPHSEQSGVQSQHPPTQWCLSGGKCNSVEWSIKNSITSLFFYSQVYNSLSIMKCWGWKNASENARTLFVCCQAFEQGNFNNDI